MKKVFLLIAALISFAVMVGSCEKPNPNDPKDPEENEDVPDNIITIDGVFTDWKGLANVAVAEVPDDEDSYPCLVTMKAVGDKSNLYLYFEFQPADDQTKAPITIEFDTDDDPSTGLSDYHWADAGWDAAIESSAGFLGNNAYMKINDFKLLTPLPGNDGQSRTWDPSNCASGAAKGVKNKGTVVNGLYCFEINVPRTLLKAEKKGTVRVGAYVEDENWKEVGILPIDDGISLSEYLEVLLP